MNVNFGGNRPLPKEIKNCDISQLGTWRYIGPGAVNASCLMYIIAMVLIVAGIVTFFFNALIAVALLVSGVGLFTYGVIRFKGNWECFFDKGIACKSPKIRTFMWEQLLYVEESRIIKDYKRNGHGDDVYVVLFHFPDYKASFDLNDIGEKTFLPLDFMRPICISLCA